MRLKASVALRRKNACIKPEILLALIVAEEIYQREGFELVITSLLDGQHMPNSKHYSGMAADIRIRHLPEGLAALIAGQLRTDLATNFDVVLEKTHIHIEYDPK